MGMMRCTYRHGPSHPLPSTPGQVKGREEENRSAIFEPRYLRYRYTEGWRLDI